MRKSLVFSAFIMSFVVGLLLSSQTYAADLGVRWTDSTASIKSTATIYNTYVSSTASDYRNNTDMFVYEVSAHPDITLSQMSNYSYPWLGFGQSSSFVGECGDWYTTDNTSKGNTTDAKAFMGAIYINLAQGQFPPNQRHYVVRHELGHIFGMGHEGTYSNPVCWTVMSYCNVSTLQAFDKNLINSWY